MTPRSHSTPARPPVASFSWPALLQSLRADFPELHRHWFSEIPPGTLEGGELLVTVDNPARLRFLRDVCSTAFAQTAMALTGHLISVRFVAPPEQADVGLASARAPASDPSPLSADYTFDQFVVGPSNRLAHAACRAVCAQPGSLYNPLFIHGSSGLGKTHLLQATCDELTRRDPTTAVTYISCEAFVNEFVRAIETGQLPQFRDRARRADALVIDDVQFLAKRESSQEELFHTFNVLYQNGKQIILSADSPPTHIPTLEDRLVSRFNWGLVTHIDPPNRETRQAILQKKARLRGYEVPEDLLDYIAGCVESNVRLLEGALTKLISETQIAGKPMTLDTARELLANLDGAPPRTLQVSDILEAVSAHFNVRLPELIGRKRSRSISHPRQVAMYLARKLTPLSLEEIGVHFGGRDHSTVLHAERVIESTRHKQTETSRLLAQLTTQLLARR
jgi:chromosomal replication initiator protein